MGGWGGLLMKAASGALAGHEQGREIADQRAQRDRAQKAQDLFTYLKLLDTPGVHVGPQAQEGTPLPKQPEGLPTSMRAVAKKPRSLIDVGSIALGGKDQEVGFDPEYTPTAVAGRKEKQAAFEKQTATDLKGAQNKQAFQMLHGEDADAYPSFVDGYDYEKEVSSFLDDQRSERTARIKAALDDVLHDADKAEKAAIKRAETRAFNLFADGADARTVGSQPGIREYLSPQDLVKLQREAAQAGKGVDKGAQTEDRLGELTASGVPEARARILANDPVLYRAWERNRMGGDAVGDLLGDEESTPAKQPGEGVAPAKPSVLSRVLGRDQKSVEDRAAELIKEHPDATDEEIAAMLSGTK